MNATRKDVARQSHDTGETPHETTVIPLRPGLAEPPKKPPATPLDTERRQAEALRLSRDENLSLRKIGERLGVTKDTVSRDIKAALRDEAQTAAATPQETCDTSETSHETPAAPDDGTPATLVLTLDEPLRQALAVLRATQDQPDTPAANRAAARAAIRATADAVLEAQGYAPEGGPG